MCFMKLGTSSFKVLFLFTYLWASNSLSRAAMLVAGMSSSPQCQPEWQWGQVSPACAFDDEPTAWTEQAGWAVSPAGMVDHALSVRQQSCACVFRMAEPFSQGLLSRQLECDSQHCFYCGGLAVALTGPGIITERGRSEMSQNTYKGQLGCFCVPFR